MTRLAKTTRDQIHEHPTRYIILIIKSLQLYTRDRISKTSDNLVSITWVTVVTLCNRKELGVSFRSKSH